MLSTILIQVHSENVAKWRLLSKQICDYLIPQLYTHSLDLDSIDALAALQKLFSHLDPPVVHESLLGLLQVFALSQSDGLDDNAVCLNKLHFQSILNQAAHFLEVPPGTSEPSHRVGNFGSFI